MMVEWSELQQSVFVVQFAGPRGDLLEEACALLRYSFEEEIKGLQG